MTVVYPIHDEGESWNASINALCYYVCVCVEILRRGVEGHARVRCSFRARCMLRWIYCCFSGSVARYTCVDGQTRLGERRRRGSFVFTIQASVCQEVCGCEGTGLQLSVGGTRCVLIGVRSETRTADLDDVGRGGAGYARRGAEAVAFTAAGEREAGGPEGRGEGELHAYRYCTQLIAGGV